VEILAFVLLAVGTVVQISLNYYYLCLLKVICNASDRSVKGRCLLDGVVEMLLLLCAWHGGVLLAFWYCLVRGMVSFLFIFLEHLGIQYGELCWVY
jgi:hypothetical protein